MEIWWTTSKVSFGGRDQKEMWAPPASLNTICRNWTPSTKFSSLSANRLLRQGKYPYWSPKSYSLIAENSVAEKAFLPFALHLSFHTPVPIKAFSCQGEKIPVLKGSNLNREDHHGFCGTWFWTLNILPCCSPGFRRSQHSTRHKSVCTFERYF